ncbi:hypothetical protein [Bifidobacterium sp. ESL0704]|uniref:hypothetical protein n=1 Tax=Bifidobacterium sp. ESL0704 TaxID=2983219 RepID=UPI0023F6DBB3|nr:hypothetical protein [Bifidobacterium sp. ESL0704]WEV53050.1 hypothetical protein OZX64_00670 [Bifidobacterium sp. ESL0704]
MTGAGVRPGTGSRTGCRFQSGRCRTGTFTGACTGCGLRKWCQCEFLVALSPKSVEMVPPSTRWETPADIAIDGFAKLTVVEYLCVFVAVFSRPSVSDIAVQIYVCWVWVPLSVSLLLQLRIVWLLVGC